MKLISAAKNPPYYLFKNVTHRTFLKAHRALNKLSVKNIHETLNKK